MLTGGLSPRVFVKQGIVVFGTLKFKDKHYYRLLIRSVKVYE